IGARIPGEEEASNTSSPLGLTSLALACRHLVPGAWTRQPVLPSFLLLQVFWLHYLCFQLSQKPTH
ncbi:MAG: hypothetical protein V7723_18400, partial [Sneathiella sp.]